MKKIVCLFCITCIFLLGACNKDLIMPQKKYVKDSKIKNREFKWEPNYTLKILASTKSSLTSKRSPDICWCICPVDKNASNKTYQDGPIIFYIDDYEIEKKGPFDIGIHILKLGDHNHIKLKEGKSYTLQVKLFMEVNNGNKLKEIAEDSSSIKYQAVDFKISEIPPKKLPEEFRKKGYWYDAFSTLTTLINNGNDDLIKTRVEFLDKVNLSDISDCEKK